MNRPYECTGCGAKGVKLWREYQTLADRTQLLCAICALRDQKTTGMPGEDGRRMSEPPHSSLTDTIKWLVPAVPSGDTFWGYSSVPPADVAWWQALPTYRLQG